MSLETKLNAFFLALPSLSQVIGCTTPTAGIHYSFMVLFFMNVFRALLIIKASIVGFRVWVSHGFQSLIFLKMV